MENLKWGLGEHKTKSTQALLLLQISDFTLDFFLFFILDNGENFGHILYNMG
jgi:hypothetical protein